MKDYLLVRVGMDVGENRWFTHTAKPPAVAGEEKTRQFSVEGKAAPKNEHVQADEQERKFTRVRDLAEGRGPVLLRRLAQRLQMGKERREQSRLCKQQKEHLAQTIAQVRLELGAFLGELGTVADDRYDCRCVYADAVRRCLILSEGRNSSQGQDNWGMEEPNGAGQRQEAEAASCWLPLIWQQYFRIPEFDAYLQPQWVAPLLENARLHHFVVLGTADSAWAAISHCAHRMKSLRWFLAEEDYNSELEDFVEDFYEENGLAVTLQQLEGKRAFTRLLLETGEPVCVLDFTGEPHIPASGLAQGSIWLDFCSVEEKARRIQERSRGVSYFSMKETWKRAGKP